MAEKTERIISVGYALPSKKVHTFILPSLITHAQKHGIHFIPINLHHSLLQQGPFDCIIHKIYDDDWNNQLLEFASINPNIPIIDSPLAIRRLHNRISMLDFIPALNIPNFGIPNQILLQEQNDDLETLGLKFPVIAKPLIANGSPNSHQLSLVLNLNGLNKMKEEQVLLQEFVNHGGVLFKVYVAGNHVKCVKRNSLPDFDVSQLSDSLQQGILPFSQISNLPATNTNEQEDAVCMPPLDFIHDLGHVLSQATQLQLFNFDLIRDVSQTSGNRYLVIDINYFPGYAKVPGFEAMITDFILDVVHHHTASTTQNM
ncbi:inositol-tetrakisphosphate 1-kinase 5-like [Amaranthus tricolor]|uniref:inositol-tetrakisphosphate 1-kinase 5-like n=1 Tax=Amaranthus tricolor TaxID=29722 RepID=UPI002589EE7F|nr:inositol-tetrakisphosphate 1-kinase 5-like [Amaranthus tricolor]